jgi:hypothetical protein
MWNEGTQTFVQRARLQKELSKQVTRMKSRSHPSTPFPPHFFAVSLKKAGNFSFVSIFFNLHAVNAALWQPFKNVNLSENEFHMRIDEDLIKHSTDILL